MKRTAWARVQAVFLLAGDAHRHVELVGAAVLLDQRFVGQHQRSARSQHRIDQQQRLARDFARGDVLHADVERVVLAVTPVGRHERAGGVVEIVEETLVEGDAGPQNRGQHDLLVGQHDFGFSQRRLHRTRRVVERAADFVGHHFADAFEVAPETHAVLLDADVADFGDETVEKRILLVEYAYHVRRFSVEGARHRAGPFRKNAPCPRGQRA